MFWKAMRPFAYSFRRIFSKQKPPQKERKLNLVIPAGLTASGSITYNFDKAVLSQSPSGFSSVLDSLKLNSETNLTFTAQVAAASKEAYLRNWPENSNDDFHNMAYRFDISSVAFVDKATVPVSPAAGPWDVSEYQNGSVMAWLTNNANGLYDLTIAGNGSGKIIANPDSSYLFYRFSGMETITGTNLLDVSQVTNMAHMFHGCSFPDIDISTWNTSNVTSMSHMFHSGSLRTPDLSHLDTSSVTNI